MWMARSQEQELYIFYCWMALKCEMGWCWNFRLNSGGNSCDIQIQTWWVKSCVMQCCVVGQVVPDVSKDCTASIFAVKQFWTATCPMTHHHILEDLEVYQYSFKNLRSHKYRHVHYHAQVCCFSPSAATNFTSLQQITVMCSVLHFCPSHPLIYFICSLSVH